MRTSDILNCNEFKDLKDWINVMRNKYECDKKDINELFERFKELQEKLNVDHNTK